MKFTIYKLRFKSPLHIGDSYNDGGASLRTIQSDSLYAALTHCLALAGEELPDNGRFDFSISSLFPFYCNGNALDKSKAEEVFFMPMPLQTKMPELPDPALAKEIKKVKWVDSRTYGKILQGEAIFEENLKGLNKIYGEYLSDTKLQEDASGSFEFIKSDVIQRASVPDRSGEGDALPFYMDRITFFSESGLFFLAVGDTTLLDFAMYLLSQEGIGSDRNVGMGCFEFEKGMIEIDFPDKSSYVTNLSLFIPENKSQLSRMLDSKEVAYDFMRRGGWISTDTTIRKNAIYGFLPGSIFHIPEEDTVSELIVLGKTVDLRPEVGDLSPDHPVWRCGKSIMLPIIP